MVEPSLPQGLRDCSKGQTPFGEAGGASRADAVGGDTPRGSAPQSMDAVCLSCQGISGLLMNGTWQPFKVVSPTLPDHYGSPRELPQLLVDSRVAADIPFKLGKPERRVGRWSGRQATASVAVPETAVYEERHAISRQNNVRKARQMPIVKAIAEAPSVQETPDRELRLRIPPTDPGHHAAPGRSINDVRHRQMMARSSRTSSATVPRLESRGVP